LIARVLSVLALMLGGCSTTVEVPDGVFACDVDDDCPEGFVCGADSRCHENLDAGLSDAASGG
jgi:hypothetical protein